jgi:hypothetical protein
MKKLLLSLPMLIAVAATSTVALLALLLVPVALQFWHRMDYIDVSRACFEARANWMGLSMLLRDDGSPRDALIINSGLTALGDCSTKEDYRSLLLQLYVSPNAIKRFDLEALNQSRISAEFYYDELQRL